MDHNCYSYFGVVDDSVVADTGDVLFFTLLIRSHSLSWIVCLAHFDFSP